MTARITTTVEGREYTITQTAAARIVAALLRIEAHDDKLNGTAPGYNDAQAPDGDDYNHVVAEVTQMLRTIRGDTATASSGQMRQPETAKTPRTKAEIRMAWERGRTIWPLVIPAGTRCKLITEGSTAGRFWVDDLSWIEDQRGLLKHDAEHYGIDIAPELVERV